MSQVARPWLIASCTAMIAACAPAAAPDDDLAPVRAALGQPMGDYPSYEERVVLYGTNRARVSPAAEGWPAYTPQPPMQWNIDLNRSSRAHSIDMRDTPCFQHPSCDGTDTFARVLSFYKGPWSTVSENIAAGVTDPLTVVHNWIYEVGAAAGETGHRDSIFSSKLTLIGCGFAPGGTTRTPNYWTQDFVGANVTSPPLTDGIHFPKAAASGGMVTFGATFYDAAIGAASPQVFVVIDGACRGLARVRGTAALGAHEAAVALADGCHPYYFVATKGDGAPLATYPDTGALQAGVGAGAAACALFAPTRTDAVCSGAGTGGGAGAGGGAAGSQGPAGIAGSGAAGTDGSGSAGTGSGAAGTPGRDSATNAPPAYDAGTSASVGGQGVLGCAVSSGDRQTPHAAAWCSLLTLAAWVARRRRPSPST